MPDGKFYAGTKLKCKRQTLAEEKTQRVNENLMKARRIPKSEFVIIRDKTNKVRELQGRPLALTRSSCV